ncbi:alanine:cation symporter family protein [Peribacillus sp. TH24]|nr:alanine:cation symporter family protein [Peribacillus sp. TH24]
MRGDPSYYLEKGLKKRWMGGLFAVSCLTLYSKYNYSCQSQFVNDTKCIKMAN